MTDVIVIGGGIIGATVAEYFSRKSRGVMLLDDGRPMSGTGPSGGHLKPGWFGGMKKAEYTPAMELLDECWGLKEEQFLTYPTEKFTTVYRVDTDKVLAWSTFASVKETVTGIDKLHNYPIVRTSTGREEQCRLLVVAAGAWAHQLVEVGDLRAKQGVSFRLKGVLKDPLIKPWAPYKQVTAHQQTSDTIWCGDGSALLPPNWTNARTDECLIRCRVAVGEKPLISINTGWRPYCTPAKATDPCLLRKLGPRAWLATGAGKSGTIAAGWVLRRLLDASSH